MKRTIILLSIITVIGVGFYLGYRQAKIAKLKKLHNILQSSRITYESCPIIASRLSQAITNRFPVTEQDIEMIFGKPDAINTNDPKFDNWHYQIRDTNRPQYYNITIAFDKSGKMVALTFSHQIIDPAMVTLIISEPYWKEKMIAQIDPKFLDPKNKQYIVQVVARTGNEGVIFSEPNWQSILPEKKYTRQLFPGEYDMYLVVLNKQEYRKIQEIPLLENVQLIKNEIKLIQF